MESRMVGLSASCRAHQKVAMKDYSEGFDSAEY